MGGGSWREMRPGFPGTLGAGVPALGGGKLLAAEHHPTPQVVGVQYAAGEEQRNSSRRDEEAEPKSGHDVQLWMSLVVKVKSDAVKNSIA